MARPASKNTATLELATMTTLWPPGPPPVGRVFDGPPAAVMIHLPESAELDAAEVRRARGLLNSKSGEVKRWSRTS